MFRVRVPIAIETDWKSPSPEVIRQGSLTGTTILVIDDDPLVREAMAQILATWDCHVHVAEDFDDAIARLATASQPDVIICDYRLRDDQTGGAVIHKLRHHFNSDVPALLITGDTAPERLREALQTGVPLMHKPVSPAELQQHLISLVVPGSRRYVPGVAN